MDCQIWQATQGQIRTVEGVSAANQAARTSAIQYNAALKALTLGAKAAAAASKALAIAGNMLTMWVLSQVIFIAANAIDNYIHRVEKAQKALDESQQAFDKAQSEIKSLNDELEKLEAHSKELERQLALNNGYFDFLKIIQRVGNEQNELDTPDVTSLMKIPKKQLIIIKDSLRRNFPILPIVLPHSSNIRSDGILRQILLIQVFLISLQLFV